MSSSNQPNSPSKSVDPLVSAGIIVLILSGVLWQIGSEAFDHPEKASSLGKVLAVLWHLLQGWGCKGIDLGVGAFFLIAIALSLATALVVLAFLWLCSRLSGGNDGSSGQDKNEVR